MPKQPFPCFLNRAGRGWGGQEKLMDACIWEMELAGLPAGRCQ